MNQFLAEIGQEVKESGLAIATDGFSAPHRIAVKQSNSIAAPEGTPDGAFYGKNTVLLPGAALYAVIQETVDGKCLMNSVIKVGVSHVYCDVTKFTPGAAWGILTSIARRRASGKRRRSDTPANDAKRTRFAISNSRPTNARFRKTRERGVNRIKPGR